ncbi:carbon-nitrogen hydrolase [Chaetomium sp. MPI-SDFR-AT-0129]|nr:carbon-nitrogen hydrolase [Chaetomium sp. MPI-SDFR-AT-0129]
MAPVYKIAIIQLVPKDVAVQDNFSRAEAFLRQAAADGAHLAVLPEYHLTSWCPHHPDFITASAESATYLPRYQALARELNLNIVPGTICEVHPAGSAESKQGGEAKEGKEERKEIRNMAYWIAAGTGTLIGTYQKLNLWHSERRHLTAPPTHASAPSPHIAFDTPLTWTDPDSEPHGASKADPIRAGMLICWDAVFPEAFRALLRQGVSLIIIPSYWTCDGTDLDPDRTRLNADCEGLFINSLMITRAVENEAVVVFCNAPGLSQVVAPVVGRLPLREGEGGKKVQGEGLGVNEEAMRVVEVDFGTVRALEREYKVKGDVLREGWHYGYERGC